MREGLFCEDVLPITWRLLDVPPPEHEIAHANEANELLLRVFAGMEERVPRRDELNEMAQELVRIETKLDLFLDLLSDLLRQTMTLPTPIPVRYSGSVVIWGPVVTPPPVEALVAIDLYLSPRIPRSLHLFARMEGLTDKGEIRACFVGMGVDVQEGLEKLVFRHHRRAVAQSRQSI